MFLCFTLFDWEQDLSSALGTLYISLIMPFDLEHHHLTIRIAWIQNPYGILHSQNTLSIIGGFFFFQIVPSLLSKVYWLLLHIGLVVLGQEHRGDLWRDPITPYLICTASVLLT